MATRHYERPSFTQNGQVYYLSNKELLQAVIDSKAVGKMSNTLARMLQLLCSKYAKKGNFVNYSYNEDMQGYAMMMLVRTWASFDPNKSNNPFAFFTQCIKHSFIQYLNQEKRQRDVRDVLLIDQGLNPSYGFELDNASDSKFEDEQDFDQLKAAADRLARVEYKEGPIERDDKGVEIVPEPVDDTPGDIIPDDLPETPAEPVND